ncbi:MAG TPA: acetyl-CoA carboxylase carboxyltransferase subunit alpha [Planctomycetota bacterium]|nr:acetyl-CoA carboxylase carboxyltransferase subunit alpha [Planctomycetota bacterium]
MEPAANAPKSALDEINRLLAAAKPPVLPNRNYLPVETLIEDIDTRILKLVDVAKTYNLDVRDELIKGLQERETVFKSVYANLSAWDRVQIARHPQRPQTLDYLQRICDDWIELAGDRVYGDDRSILTGLATIGGQRFMFIGQHKGRDVKERAVCNSGCPHPEGYRKALQKMRMAERFGIPVLTFIDTKGAFPGIGAEERGQAGAIAENIREMAGLRVPILTVVIGEGGSGGALAIGVGDRLAIMEQAYYSVISPEGCAAILWRTAAQAPRAAEALKLTAQDLKRFRVADDLIPEPYGAHWDVQSAADNIKSWVLSRLAELQKLDLVDLLQKRYEKLRAIGVYQENQAGVNPELRSNALGDVANVVP